MPLVKVEHGVLEEDNFYLTSPASDFLGGGVWSRTEELFRLKSGEVMRRLPYESFMLDVRKDPSSGGSEFFLKSGGLRLGLSDNEREIPATDLRIVYYDGFVQGFASYDGGQVWESTGGSELEVEDEILQGFRLTGEEELILTRYRMYRSPYLTIQNFPPGALARLTDSDGSTLERFFDSGYECRLLLERERSCAIEITNDGETLFSAEAIEFTPGDVYLFTQENIRLLRGGKALGPGVANCGKFETFTVRNEGEQDAENVSVTVENTQDGAVLLSRDGETWYSTVSFERIEAGGEYEFHLKITQGESEGQFKVGHFELTIF